MTAVSNVRITPGTGTFSQVSTTSLTSSSIATLNQYSGINISNNGSGVGLFEGVNSAGSYLFKSIIAGPGIILTSSGREITISANSVSSGSTSGSLAAVAYSGSYTDLINKPTIPSIPTVLTLLSELLDVNGSILPTTGQVLTFNGTKWAPATPSSGNFSIGSITPTLGQVLTYSADGSWEPTTPSSGITSLPLGTPQIFHFDISYSNGPDLPSAINLPSGWSAITTSSNVTITHNLGKNPADISYHQSVVNGSTVTTNFIILGEYFSLASTPPPGGFLQYDTTNMNQIILEAFTADNVNFNYASIIGAVVRVYVTFV
jgi:hypothetical protein